MSLTVMNERLLRVFPCMKAVPPDKWAASQPKVRTFPSGTQLFGRDEAASYGLFLLNGSARIKQFGEDGDERVVGTLVPGEVCALFVLSGLSGRDYPAVIEAETEVEALFVSKSSFLGWVQEYEPIRGAVFGSLLEGIMRIGERLHAKATKPLDARLAEALLRSTSERQPVLATTHRELAADIGSAREVVSRALARFERQGTVETGRGWVRVASREALEAVLGLGDQVTDAMHSS